MLIKRIDFSRRFEKNLKKAPTTIKKAFRIRLEIFLTDKFSPLLNNHALIGKYEGYRSFNVSGDWRAVFRELNNREIIYFDLLGTHSQLYR